MSDTPDDTPLPAAATAGAMLRQARQAQGMHIAMLAAATKEQLANPRDVSSLRYLRHGASPISAETLHRARQAFPDAELMHIYGTTETTPITTLLTHEERLLDTHLVGTCGQPAVGVQVRVFDTVTGKQCQPSDVGELMVRSSSVMQGYWNKPAETDHAFLDGWYRTGGGIKASHSAPINPVNHCDYWVSCWWRFHDVRCPPTKKRVR